MNILSGIGRLVTRNFSMQTRCFATRKNRFSLSETQRNQKQKIALQLKRKQIIEGAAGLSPEEKAIYWANLIMKTAKVSPGEVSAKEKIESCTAAALGNKDSDS